MMRLENGSWIIRRNSLPYSLALAFEMATETFSCVCFHHRKSAFVIPSLPAQKTWRNSSPVGAEAGGASSAGASHGPPMQ